MKKGYYLHFGGRLEPGIGKKIDAQLKEFRKTSDITEFDVCQTEYKRTLLKKILYRIPLVYRSKFDYSAVLAHLDCPNFLYIRKFFADKYFIAFLRACKQKYPQCKIVVEIPTYPYMKDNFTSIKTAPLIFKELGAIPKFCKYIDRFATYSTDNMIYGVPTLRIKNGIYVDDITPRAIQKKHDDSIVLLAVATFRKHHGYERILKGISEYYQKCGMRKLTVNMVGSGDELEKYKKLTAELGIQDYVHFRGRMVGTQLDDQYSLADVALGSFGMYKIGLYHSSVLKIREYTAKGLPIVSGCHEDAFEDEAFSYYLECPNDGSTVDMERVITFYDNICRDKDPQMQIDEIRQYALRHLNYDMVFKPVTDYLDD